MQSTITVTRKGQTTLPVAIRRKLGLGPHGGRLIIRFSERKREATITQPPSIEELSERITSYIRPGTKPLLNVDEYYQRHRTPRL